MKTNSFLMGKDPTQRRKDAKGIRHSPFAIWCKQNLPLLFAILFVLSACDTPTVSSPVSVLPSPTATATLTATLTSTPMPTATPTPTTTQTPIPTSITVLITPLPDNGMPESMWPPIQQETSTMLTSRNGLLTYEMLPVQTALFWDYAGRSGRLAFSAPHPLKERASCECTDSDLWIYDYTTDEVEMWLPEHVENAAWSPVIDPATGSEYLAVVTPDSDACRCSSQCYNMIILSVKEQIVKFIENASPHFSWSPDGQWITYFGGVCSGESQGVYVAPIKEGESRKIARLNWINSIYDRPIWAQEHEMILYPEAGAYYAAPIDGSGEFRLLTLDAQPVFVEAQYAVLWSAKRRQLILAGEAGMDTPSRVIVYELSKDLHTATSSYVAGENVRLLGWLDQEETLILAARSQITVWSLEDKAPVSP